MKPWKKIAAVAILTGVILAQTPVPFSVRPAKALFGVGDIVFDPTVAADIVKGIVQHIKEYAEEFALETLKQRLLDMMVDQIIFWIQGGGKPKFVTDWQGFLRDAANIAAGDFAKQLGLGFLCRPFNLQVQVSLLPTTKFSRPYDCTLDQITDNINNFYQNFRSGGWVTYVGSLQPRNNYFGASLLAEAELEDRKLNAQAAAQNEALAGGGFTSVKSCDEDGSNSGADIDGDGTAGDIPTSCVVTVPGQSVQALLNKSLMVPIDRILNAAHLGDYVGAIAAAITNRLIIEGVKGIQGLTTPNAPAGGTVGGGIGKCAGLSGPIYAACLNYVASSRGSFKGAKKILLDQIAQSLGPRQEADDAYNDSLSALSKYMTDLQNLQTLFNSLTCTNKAAYLADLTTEMQYASTTNATVSNGKTLNKTFLDPLIIARDQIKNLASGDWDGLSAASVALEDAGTLDPLKAEAVRDAAIAQNQTIQTHITQAIQRLNQELLACQMGP